MRTIVLGKKFVDSKYDFRETCFGICEKNGLLLLTKNTKKNEIAMVGGGLEKGETHEDCLKREFLEESGYTIESIDEFCTIDCFWLAGGERPMESLANFYIVKLSDNVVVPIEEGHEPIWVPVDEVEDLLPLPYHKEAIKQYLSLKNK